MSAQSSNSSGGKGCAIAVIATIVLMLIGLSMVSLIRLTQTTGREQWAHAFLVVLGIACVSALFVVLTQWESDTTSKEQK